MTDRQFKRGFADGLAVVGVALLVAGLTGNQWAVVAGCTVAAALLWHRARSGALDPDDVDESSTEASCRAAEGAGQ